MNEVAVELDPSKKSAENNVEEMARGRHRKKGAARRRGAPPIRAGNLINPPRNVGFLYRVTGAVGKGGFADVLEAEHRVTGGKVAIKLGTPDDPEKLAAEGEAVRKLKSPNVLRVRKSGTLSRWRHHERRKVPYLVTELAEEGSLKNVLERRGQFPVGEAFAVTAQIASALETIHEKGLVHGDIKPANILVKKSGSSGEAMDVVLGDFGEAGPPGKTAALTYEYAAPEQLFGKTEFASDVYSLGLVLYELETGERFFTKQTTEERKTKLPDREKHNSLVKARLEDLKKISPQSASLLRDILRWNAIERLDAKMFKTRLLDLDRSTESAIPQSGAGSEISDEADSMPIQMNTVTGQAERTV